MFLRRFRRKGDFGVRRNWEGSGSCVLMSVRDMDVLRLLCWCQNVRPDDLSSISTETERENLITLGLIKRHQRSDTLLLTNSGRAFLQAALEGDVPNLTLSYHDAAIERRVRLSALMMTAYHAGINVFTITANSLAEPSTLFITAITRSRGHNPWGSAPRRGDCTSGQHLLRGTLYLFWNRPHGGQ